MHPQHSKNPQITKQNCKLKEKKLIKNDFLKIQQSYGNTPRFSQTQLLHYAWGDVNQKNHQKLCQHQNNNNTHTHNATAADAQVKHADGARRCVCGG